MREKVIFLTRLKELLSGRQVMIQTHDFPDPDAIASAAGLQYLLAQYEIPATICYFGKIDKVNNIRMVDWFAVEMLQAEGMHVPEEAVVITVDGQKNNSNFTDLPGEEIACIDHHPWTTQYEYQLVDHELVGACATLITEYFKALNLVPPKRLATALLYGIKMDTMNFSRGVTKRDIAAYEFLFEYADETQISRLNNSSMELEDMKAYGTAIQNILLYQQVGFAYIPFDCPDGLIASISEFILALDAVEVSVVYVLRNGGYKFSVRSEVPCVNAGRLLNCSLRDIGNGGGHPTMAGGLIYKERVHLLEPFVHENIRKRFLEQLEVILAERKGESNGNI